MQDYGPKFLDLPEDKIEQLQSLITKLNLRDTWARQIEIIRCTTKRYFWLGMQHVWWNNDASMFQVGAKGGAVVAENMNEENTAAQDFNIYKPNGKIFTAVFAQNPATIRSEPDQPQAPESIRAAKEAEKYIRVYDKYNPAQDAQITIGRLLWNDGRVISITEPSDEGDWECTEYRGVLETKVPIYETDKKFWPYCKVSLEHDVLTMKQKHPDVADKIQAGGKSASPNDETSRMARISTAESITQLSHDTLQYLVTEDRWWLRPSAFMDMEKPDRDFWMQLFPEGCKLTFCGPVFCGAEAVSLDDAIDVMHAEPGEGQARNSLGDPHIPVQMEFNDAMNLTSELLKYAVPSLWADIDETEFAAIKEQVAQYGQIRPKKRKTGEPMENDFFPEPQVSAPDILPIWIENLQGALTQLVTLNQPAMFGANMDDQKTAKAYQQALQQSLGVLTIIWVPFKKFVANIHEQACRIASKREQPFSAMVDGKNNKQETLSIDPKVLQGGFTFSAVPDQSFPESPDQKSQTIMGLMAAAPTNPILAATLQLPDNLVLQRDAIGLTDFVIEGADARDKQLEEWLLMQKGEGPEPDMQATQQRNMQAQQAVTTLTGGNPAAAPPLPALPPVMKSSVEVDPDTDDHVNEALECFRLLNSPEGLKIKAAQDMGDGRPGLAIWTDLKMHFLAHMAAGQGKGLIFPPPLAGPPPMPMPAPAGPKPPGAKPDAPPTGGPPNAPPTS